MHWRIELFGGLRAIYGKEILTQFRSRKAGSLLAYLTFFRGPHPRDTLVEMLWPEFPLEAGRNSLRVSLADLRRRSTLLIDSGAELSPPLLLQDRGSVGLPPGVTTDVTDFEKAVDEARRAMSLEIRVAAYERAITFYRGALLPGFYESWIPAEEARLEAVFLHVLKSLEAFYENSGNSLRAFELAQLAARYEPQQSRKQQKSPANRNASARLSATKARSRQETETITSPTSSSPSKKVVAPLPASFTRFFGREAELQELAPLLSEGRTRLLTITGGGGMGKTRLSLELARSLSSSSEKSEAPRFERVFWVPLAGTPDAERLSEELIKVLNLDFKVELDAETPRPRTSLQETIANLLREESEDGTRTLLVLDNFEQLLPKGSVMLGELLERVPNLTLLVTSRQRLNLTGEREHRLKPLALPPRPLVAPTNETIWDEQQLTHLRESSSVQLFTDRAHGARSDWRLLPREASTLISLLHRLEGVPLAIELIASRAGVLSLEHMLIRLSQGLQWVSSRDQHRPVRHRSLHAVLEWSLQLLPVHQQEIFARLSVFHGGWTLDDAATILSDVDPDTFLDTLQSLHDASLITSEESDDGALRFSMLEIVRQIAEEKLEGAQSLATRRSHAEFYFQIAQRASTNEKAMGRRDVWGATEGHNFSAALDFWASTELERALEMAASLWWYWIFSYHLPEGRHTLKQLLAHPQIDEFPIARARIQNSAAYISLLSGSYEEAEELLNAALVVWAHDDFQREQATSLNLAGALAMALGNREKARDCYAQSLELHRAVGTRHEITIGLNALAGIERACGHLDAAHSLCAEALELAQRHQDRSSEAWTLHTLGFLALDAGDFKSARDYQEKSLAMRRKSRHPHAEAGCLEALGELAEREGDLLAAREHYQQALEIWHHIDQPPRIQTTQKRLEALAKEIEQNASVPTP
ncbi:putative HTH-type transcriptional regulator [Abditibacteriota bacterium]|nr:putative HTH-type transcriptional regulator [Abditibacteriota bacterium]